VTDADPLGGLGHDAESPGRDQSVPEAPRRREVHRAPPAPTTLALLALLGAMFLVEIAVGGKFGADSLALFRLGALSPAAVLDGDWWRIGSYAFLHAGPLHLLFNAYALWILMRPLEGMFGAATSLGLFSATAIVGGAASIAAALFLRHVPWQSAVGASGGIFGLFGAHIALYWRLRTRLTAEQRRGAARTLLVNLLLNLVLAFGASAVGLALDNAAHAGGFLSGIALGLIAPSHVLPRRSWNTPAFGLLAVATLALAAMESAAIARAVRPAPRTLRAGATEVRLPWNLIPGPDGRALSVDGYAVAIRRARGSLVGGHPMTLGNREWAEFSTETPQGTPMTVLASPDGATNVVVEAWCEADCSDQDRAALAEQVAASMRAVH